MRLPVGPDRSTGAGERARLEEFRLRRGLTLEEGPTYAAARLAALDAPEPGGGPAWRPLGPFAVPHGRTAGFGPGSRPRVAGRVGPTGRCIGATSGRRACGGPAETRKSILIGGVDHEGAGGWRDR